MNHYKLYSIIMGALGAWFIISAVANNQADNTDSLIIIGSALITLGVFVTVVKAHPEIETKTISWLTSIFSYLSLMAGSYLILDNFKRHDEQVYCWGFLFLATGSFPFYCRLLEAWNNFRAKRNR